MIGENIRRARMAQGLTQRQAAERAAISQPSLCQIERGNRNATTAVLEKLAKAWGVSLAQLVDPENARRADN